jgi:hypothetical protein
MQMNRPGDEASAGDRSPHVRREARVDSTAINQFGILRETSSGTDDQDKRSNGESRCERQGPHHCQRNSQRLLDNRG